MTRCGGESGLLDGWPETALRQPQQTPAFIQPAPPLPPLDRCRPQYNQALIAASGGALSLSFDVAVLPETLVDRDTSSSDAFLYYEEPAQQVR